MQAGRVRFSAVALTLASGGTHTLLAVGECGRQSNGKTSGFQPEDGSSILPVRSAGEMEYPDNVLFSPTKRGVEASHCSHHF